MGQTPLKKNTKNPMKSNFLTAMAFLGIVAAAQADPVTINFQAPTPNTDVGPTADFTVNGITVRAHGFTTGGSPTDLFSKFTSGDPTETGLGINNDPSGEHEIYPGTFIQIQLLTPLPPGTAYSLLVVGSVQSGETVHIYSTTTPGTLT